MMRTKHGLLAMVVMTLTACATPPVDQPPSLPSPSPPTGGIPVPPNLPAPSLPARSVPTSESGSGEATTADERRAVLDIDVDSLPVAQYVEYLPVRLRVADVEHGVVQAPDHAPTSARCADPLTGVMVQARPSRVLHPGMVLTLALNYGARAEIGALNRLAIVGRKSTCDTIASVA